MFPEYWPQMASSCGFLGSDVGMYNRRFRCGTVAFVLIISCQPSECKAGERKTKWSIPFVLLFIALATNVGKNANGLAIFLTLPGAALIVLGQKTIFGDRKRGDFWMSTGKVNPDPIVYSYGELYFMTGWILFSLAMSITV